MYLRDTDFPTLTDFVESNRDRRLYATGNSVNIEVRLDDGTEEADTVGHEEGTHRRGTIVLGEKEIPATGRGLAALGSYFDIPTKFLGRIHADEQQFILNHRIQRSEQTPVVLRWTEAEGVTSVYNNNQTRVDRDMLFERLLQEVPEESQVVDFHDDGKEWWSSVIPPEGFDRWIGGDKKVNDITYGGVRFGHDYGKNLAPWVQTYLYRLACTNGMEIPEYGLRVDARNVDDAADISAMWGSEVRRALDSVGQRIDDFYALREVKASDDRTGEFRRIALDAGLPARAVGQLEDTLADALMAEDEVTLFHMINHVTNRANQPGLRPTAARRFQQAGGQTMNDHVARCGSCHAKLN